MEKNNKHSYLDDVCRIKTDMLKHVGKKYHGVKMTYREWLDKTPFNGGILQKIDSDDLLECSDEESMNLFHASFKLISVNRAGEDKNINKSFTLNAEYRWVIDYDEDLEQLILIPTKKTE